MSDDDKQKPYSIKVATVDMKSIAQNTIFFKLTAVWYTIFKLPVRQYYKLEHKDPMNFQICGPVG